MARVTARGLTCTTCGFDDPIEVVTIYLPSDGETCDTIGLGKVIPQTYTLCLNCQLSLIGWIRRQRVKHGFAVQ